MSYYLTACTMVRDEPDLREWAAYHVCVGFEHLYVYDNGSKLPVSLVLGDFVAKGLVTLFKVAGSRQQCDTVYVHAISLARLNTRWMAFIDGDEFILPHEVNDVRCVLEAFEKAPA